MRARDRMTASAGVLVALLSASAFAANASAERFEELAARCAPDIHPATLKGLVSTESSGNPYAIGVVGGSLPRQPRSLEEAVSAARDLERKGFNFSMGLGQVNRYNLTKYGHTYETIFEPCGNLKAGGEILKDCYVRARKQIGDDQQALRAAFSCYYSGNFTRGFRPDQAGQPSYVQKVVANAVDVAQALTVPAVEPRASDGAALPSRVGSPASAGASRSNAASSPWVVIAGDQPAREAARDEAEPAKAPAVRVQVMGNPAPAPEPHQPEPAQQQPSPGAAFVQFVN